MLLYCIKSVFKDSIFKNTMCEEFYASIIMNKYFNKTAQRWNSMQDSNGENVNQK